MSDATLEEFIDRLSQGHYFPGQRLTEQSIIDDFNISRGRTRLFLQELQAAGIVEIHKNKGASIRRYSDNELHVSFMIRQRLEGLAAYLAAQNFNPKSHPQQLALFRGVLEDKLDIATFRQSNKLFHGAILELAQSSSLERVVKSMVIPMQHIQFRAFLNESYEQASKQEHMTIAAAILNNDAEAAEKSMQAHLNNARLRVHALKIIAV